MGLARFPGKTGAGDPRKKKRTNKRSNGTKLLRNLSRQPGLASCTRFSSRTFPEWQTVYSRPKRHARSGNHIFKATLTGWRGGGGGIWRRLAVPADATLEDLALAILQAFKLDNDHLYDFRYRDERGKRRQYNHSEADEGPYLHEITVGESELPLKAEMDFTFDYGDHWQFKVRLEEVDLGSSPVGQPKVIESAGEPPPQYPPAE